MTSKQNITFHLDGINACEEREYEHALGLFMRIQEPSAAIYFNMGCCYLRLENPTEAQKMFQQCVARDKYMAVGFFQLGVSQTLCGDMASAINSFQAAYNNLRGNTFLDYKQLNMSCKLYACEIHFNQALLYLFSGDRHQAREKMNIASELPTDSTRHTCIPDAHVSLQREDWNYFGQGAVDRLINLPEQSFFRVSKAKMEGLQTSTKFMDPAKVVSASKDEYSFVGFVGAAKNRSPSMPVQQTSPSKRPSPPAGPPPPMPTVPPPRLPPGVSQPGRNLPAPIPIKANTLPNPKSSPSKSVPGRPPPPSLPAPSPNTSFTPPAKRLNRISNEPILGKPPTSSSPGMISELRKSLDNVMVKNAPKSTPSSQQPYASTNKKTQDVQLECEFNLTIKGDVSYPELLKKLSERLSQASADLENSLQRKTMTLSLQNPSKRQANVTISPQSNAWQTELASLTKNRQQNMKIILKENSNEASPSTVHKAMRSPPSRSPVPSPRPPSPGYRPSRPAPVIRPEANSDTYEEEEDDIYHEVS